MTTRLSSRESSRWKAYYRGPRDLHLCCRGSTLARGLAALHFAWPFARGQYRFVNTLSASSLHSSLRDIPFRSSCDVPVRLDLASMEFLHLSGRLPAEPLELSILARVVKSGDVFVDVGTYWGMYIPHILGRIGDGAYWAFEPSPANTAFLRRAFRECGPRLHVVQAAVSDHIGETYLHRDGSSEAYISQERAQGVAVRVTRLDHELAAVDQNATVVMKIDTEGQEAAVIRGCVGMARRGIQPILFLEFLPAMHGQTREGILDAIKGTFGSDYSFWAMDQADGSMAPFATADKINAGVRNMLAVPHRHSSRLDAIYEE